MTNRLQGKVAIVTGGGRGIGRGICRRFAREGASVVVAELDEADGAQVANDLEALGGKGIFVRTDVTEKSQVQRMVKTAVDTFGRVDILVNNAIALSEHVAFERKTDARFVAARRRLRDVLVDAGSFPDHARSRRRQDHQFLF
jgi:3-oxoacyl-[acyl-carrier protein] reductase